MTKSISPLSKSSAMICEDLPWIPDPSSPALRESDPSSPALREPDPSSPALQEPDSFSSALREPDLASTEVEASLMACEPTPFYYRETIPNFWRRDKKHDYYKRCIYMLTMRKSVGMPDFSSISARDGNPYKPSISLSQIGAIVNNEIRNIPRHFSSVKLFDYVVMPDHIHIVVYLSEEGKHPGEVVKKFKGECSRAWQLAQGLSDAEELAQGISDTQQLAPVFINGYHDRYSRSREHLETIKRYVRDNPRRLLIKRLYPEYFRKRRRISIDGKIYVMIGNPFLILHPFISQALHSSRRSYADNRNDYEKCLANIERGGVTIGTFFAHPEKELRDKAIATGGSVILMQGNGFNDFYAPQQPYFDLCMQGRCLIIGEERYRTSTSTDIREHNRAMNAVAARIASGEAILSKPQ